MVGWALSDQIDRRLCLDALHMAIRDRSFQPGCIHHSDQGAQYRSLDYLDLLKTYQFKISMSAKAQPGENAFIESFFKTVKYEEVTSLGLPNLSGRHGPYPLLHRGGLQSEATALFDRLYSTERIRAAR